MAIEQQIISTWDIPSAARRVAAWVDSCGDQITVVAVAQAVVDNMIHSTIWFRYSGVILNSDDVSKLRPRTGQKRLTRQPLSMDKLPKSVLDAVTYLRKQGKTWSQIETLSARNFSEKWALDGLGFVDWQSLPSETLRLFPRRRIPHSNMHRWYDLRVEQGVAV